MNDDSRGTNVFNVDLDQEVWRVFAWENLLLDVKNATLTLPRVGRWEDPFENFLSKVRFRLSSGERVDVGGILSRFFGQCWTVAPRESDATWRIYSQDKNGVRIRSTVDGLFAALWDDNDKFSSLKYFAGRVRYVDEGQIAKAMSSSATATALLTGSGGRDQVRALLFKRTEFEHEQEFRLLFRDIDGGLPTEALFQRPAVVTETYLEAVFDPRLDDLLFSEREKELRNAGFAGPIRRSQLYTIPSSSVTLQ